jgi:purine-binding chemotaxis protein CheW
MTRILVVDDDPIANEMVSAILAGAGYVVGQAGNISQAIETIGVSDQIDIIVSDMHMPGGSGLDLYRHVKSHNAEIGFILLSGDDPTAILDQESQIDACLLKDFTIAQTLPVAVSDVLTRCRSGQGLSVAASIEMGSALVDTIQGLRARFLNHLPETLEQAAGLCTELPNIPLDKIETLVRIFHGIKGNAASFGLALISHEADLAEKTVVGFFAMEPVAKASRSSEIKRTLENSIRNIASHIEPERAGDGNPRDSIFPALVDIEPIRVCVLDLDSDSSLFNVMLLEQLNFIAESVGELKSLLDHLIELQADLLLVDVPESDSDLYPLTELLPEIKVPVLFLIGTSGNAADNTFYDPRKSATLNKPVDPDALQKAILDLVSSRRSESDRAISLPQMEHTTPLAVDPQDNTTELDAILAERKSHAPVIEEDVPEITFLVFTLGNDWFAFPGTAIKEVMANAPVFFLPGCPPTIEGVVNIRGEIESVISLRAVFGMPKESEKTSSRILLGHAGEISSGLRVDRVEEVVNRRSNEINMPPSHLPKPLASLVSGIFNYGPHLVAILDLSRIFSDYSLSSEGI